MQFKLAALFTLAIATLAAATPTKRDNSPNNQCNTGKMQCCESVQPADSAQATSLLGLVGTVVHDVSAMVGITCSPISGVGIGGNSCTAQPTCCTGNSFDGVIVIGCSPININL
ncbi:hypothetical protein D9619_013267 [Psilocybe cf. subviscida]|uniref:Hydrophobin n=1 Tax=Psilocybe cf. subviscida TaxID=2480587 RepID=A0A8H5F979_9AGAR|nr:hypothetical protein D9619_013267 [Psilocybe cf. subviscida]